MHSGRGQLKNVQYCDFFRGHAGRADFGYPRGRGGLGVKFMERVPGGVLRAQCMINKSFEIKSCFFSNFVWNLIFF